MRLVLNPDCRSPDLDRSLDLDRNLNCDKSPDLGIGPLRDEHP